MDKYVLVFIGVVLNLTICSGLIVTITSNQTKPGKDMYVIHAMVYQVGIITNSSSNDLSNATGKQESISIYQHNGTKLDLAGVSPLLTNVTVQSMVGLAPINQSKLPLPGQDSQTSSLAGIFPTMKRMIRRSLNTPLEVEEGITTLKKDIAIKSLIFPPLLALNSNFSSVPVPIPNTSVVNYTKISTVFKKD